MTFFGRLAELVGEYLGKGSPIFIEGRLKQDTWEKDGQKRSKLYVIADRIQFLQGKSDGSRSDGGASRTRDTASHTPAGATSSRFMDPSGYGGNQGGGPPPEIHEEPVYNDEEMPF